MDSLIMLVLACMLLPIAFVLAVWLFPLLLLFVVWLFALSCKGFFTKMALILFGALLYAYIEEKINKEDDEEN